MFVSLILALLQWFLPDPLKTQLAPLMGFVWFVFFTFNLMVISFEFGKGIVVAIFLLLVITILAAALLFTVWGVTLWINPAYLGLIVNANTLLAFFLVFGLVILLSWVSTRFFYFRVTHNEIIYKKGILGDVERYATANVTVHKEITDIFEYVLFRSGRLTIEVPGRKLAIPIDNIPRINRVEHKVLHLLGRIEIDKD
jgi:membrane protein implicated in regulation of membrane protease activity